MSAGSKWFPPVYAGSTADGYDSIDDPHGHHANAESTRMERAWDLGAASREGWVG